MKKINFIAMLLIFALLCGCAAQTTVIDTSTQDIKIKESDYLARAEYPQQAPYPDESVYNYTDGSFATAYDVWSGQNVARRQNYEYLSGKLDNFISATVPAVLGSTDSNSAYSPLNLYMALSMLAQTADGESQEQILDLLNIKNTEDLATLATKLFNAHYLDDGAAAVIPANALFLRDDMSYKNEVLQKLSQNYYASVLHGKMGSDGYNQILQSWINEQTGGLLETQASDLKMDDDCIMMLVSTLYFSANWSNKFSEPNNTVDTFYDKDGESQATYMHRESEMTYYADEKFSAVQCYFENSGSMWLILPDEGVEVNELVQNGVVSQMLSPAEDKTYYHKVNLSVPKFDIISTLELNDTLKELGIQDVFEMDKADFGNLTDDSAYLSQVSHNVRVTIDEEGCTAAAYTALGVCGAAAPRDDKPIDFTLDRPFIFVITAESGLPLFVGVVQKP